MYVLMIIGASCLCICALYGIYCIVNTGLSHITHGKHEKLRKVISAAAALCVTLASAAVFFSGGVKFCDRIYQNSYDEGYDSGEKTGAASGYDSGFTAGKNTGYAEGFESGEEKGYLKGVRDAEVLYEEKLLEAEKLSKEAAERADAETEEVQADTEAEEIQEDEKTAETSENAVSAENTETDVLEDTGTEMLDENERTVYFTKTGKVYHISKDCSYLRRSNEILSGTISEAGDRTPCSRCAKQ